MMAIFTGQSVGGFLMSTPSPAPTLGGAVRPFARKTLAFILPHRLRVIPHPADAAAFLSPNYLTHLLRKETGSSFTDLVLERRMRLARTHLINTDKPLGQIAWACGFTDEAYFSRRFSKAFGMPPGQFRRQQQNL